MNKRILAWICNITIIMGLAGFFLSTPIWASEKREVKVAFFPMEGYHIIEEDGNYGGMDVAYLEVLSEYTGWNVSYIPCDSWEDALARLEAKEVDLVGTAQYSSERAKIFDYADLASGYTYGVIATNPDSTIAYEDFEAMQDITFGMVHNYVRSVEFFEYLADGGIQTPKVKEYTSTQELHEALDAGEVDAFVHTFMEVEEGQRLVGRFAPRPIYYITYKGNTEVLRELNQAIADMKMSHPELEADLMKQFYESRWDKSVIFSTEEKKYLAEKEELVIGYLDGYYPFSYEEDGFNGLTKQILEEGLSPVGLKLTYEKMTSQRAAEDALRQGEIDVLAYSVDISNIQADTELTELSAYAQIPLVLVVEKDKGFEDISTLVTVPELTEKVSSVLNMEIDSVVTEASVEECLAYLSAGKADGVLCDGYLAEHLISTKAAYSDLDINNVLNGEHQVHMVIRNERDSALKGILNKTIITIDAKRINEFTLKENDYPLVTFRMFMRDNSIAITGGLLGIIIVIIIVAAHMIRDGRRIQKLLYKDTGMDIWNLNYLLYTGENKLLPERKKQYAVVCVNIVKLRRFNVVYGWDAGEELLGVVKNVLQTCVDEKEEICARSYGDRFVLLLVWDNWRDFVTRLLEIQRIVEKQIYKDTENHMSLHMGVYAIPEESRDLKLAVSYANQALEVTGNNNTSEIKIYDAPFEDMIRERHDREKLLESVEIEGNFVAYYQSKVDVRTNQMVGAEALVRFKDPSANGVIRSPGYFVPYYEQTGRILDLDFFVLKEVCKLLRKRLDEGKAVVPVSCNFSRIHFAKDGFAEHFESVLDEYKIDKALIEVEITETLVVEELQKQRIKQTIKELVEKGVHLSIDDFGAGYSSLGVFEQIPASVVKLDRSFLLNHEDHDRQVHIMKSIVKLTNDLDAQVVCEGVENAEHVYLMKEIEAYIAQGYFYCRPMPEAEFEERLDMLDGNVKIEWNGCV